MIKLSFKKIIKGRRYQVIAVYLREEAKWLVLSTWVKGEDDKIPFVWQLLVFPFRLIYQISIYLIKQLVNICKNCRKK